MFPGRDEPNQIYAGMVASLDENIGRVLRKLEQLGIEENTLVALASDNGETTDLASKHPELARRLAKAWRDRFAAMPPAISKTGQ